MLISVAVRRLDELIGHVDGLVAVEIDPQDAEHAVISGGRATLAEDFACASYAASWLKELYNDYKNDISCYVESDLNHLDCRCL